MDPDLYVALGAAIQGALIAGEDAGPVLVEITPHTLGVAAVNPINQELAVVSLIPRNSAFCCSRTEVFQTQIDNQKVILIEAYQGESPDPDQDILIGRYKLEGFSDLKRGSPILCKYELDLNGMLKITTTEKETGKTAILTLKNAFDSREGTSLDDEDDFDSGKTFFLDTEENAVEKFIDDSDEEPEMIDVQPVPADPKTDLFQRITNLVQGS
ncbi:MAG: Hsp70 family protein [Planctomycetia bacterium]|nr:Hsp70 family protein [Planctomycetia bacterium]